MMDSVRVDMHDARRQGAQVDAGSCLAMVSGQALEATVGTMR